MKSTKKSLLLSTLSLILCFAMLLGTTWAWFTDEVQSGVNRIVAGNLDVELLHTSASVTTAASVKGQTNLFTDKTGNAMLWEPGAVSYENFTVSNVGTLAFKYNMNLNITDYNAVTDTAKDLREPLKVKVLTGENILTSVTRDTVAALDWTNAQSLVDFKKDGGTLYPTTAAGKTSSEAFQVIVYWQPGDNDNQWNVNNGATTTDGQPLFVEFGINLVATQLEYEKDSFGDDYDANRTLPILPQSINKTFETPTIGTTIEGGSVSIKTIGGVSAGNSDVIVKNKSNNTGVGSVKQDSVKSVVEAMVTKIGSDKIDITSDQNSIIYIDIKTTKAPTTTEAEYDISLSAQMTYIEKTAAEEKVEKTVEIEHLTETDLGGKTVVATIDLGAGLKGVKVSHNTIPMNKLSSATPGDDITEGYFYDEISGVLTIISKSFSPFEVTYVQPKSISECKHEYEYAQFDSYSHTTTCKFCDYNETEPHQFEDGKCKLCGYKGTIGKIQIHTENAADYVCITDAGMTNKDGQSVEKILNGAIEYDSNTKTLKLMQDVNVNQIDFTCDKNGSCGAILDLNGYILTCNSWTALDIYANAQNDGDQYGYEGYSLVINDSNPDAVHNGKIYYAEREHYYTSSKGWKYDGYEWFKEGSTPNGEFITEYVIKGGIITNVSAGKYGSAGDPYDGGGLSTCGKTTVTFNAGTFAGINADGDVGAIAMGKTQSSENCKLFMNEGASIVGCSGGTAGVRMYGSGHFELNGGKFSYCSGWEIAHAVYTEESSEFIMNDGIIEHCYSEDRRPSVINLMGSGKTELLGGTITDCDAYAIIWNSDAKLVLDGVTIKDCFARGGAYGGFLIMEATFEGNPTLTIKGSTKLINNTTQNTPIADNVDSRVKILGGDFTQINDDATQDLLTSIDKSFEGIQGGSFKDIHKAFVTSHLADGCAIVDNGNGTFTVTAP